MAALGWLLNLGFAGSGAVAGTAVDLSPATVEGRSVQRIVDGITVTRLVAGASINRTTEGRR